MRRTRNTRREICTAFAVAGVSLAGCLGSDDNGEGAYTVDVIDREAGAVVADYHGHWHGDLPSIPVDGHRSLGAEFEAENGDPVPLGNGRRLDATVAASDGGAVGIDSHGDHVRLTGESAGGLSVVFQLVDGETVVWETGAIDAVVE